MPVLDFKGKSVIYSHHLRVPFRSLKVDKQKSFSLKGKGGKKVLPSLEDNLIIHGDNLHALKALMPRYAGKIKCIYIDPPYNTGNEGWKYNDKVNSPIMKEWFKQNDIGTDDLERHDKWLCMMWPRLQLLKELLSDDGVIFISIDDNEQHHLHIIMNEIFGEENLIGTMKRRASRKTAHLSQKMSDMCDYVVGYCKNELNAPLGVTPVGDLTRPVLNSDNSICKRFIPAGAKAICADGLYEKGIYTVTSMQFNLLNDLKIKNNQVLNKVAIEGRFRVSQDILDRSVYITKNFGLRRYVLPEETSKIKAMHDLIDQREFYNEVGFENLKEIFQKKAQFQNPKPFYLIKFLITAQQNGYKKNDYIILDSFAGSGTTAQAVLDLNKEDGGNRKFILVECEDYADKITAERVRRVIKGVSKAKDEKIKKGLGGSFTYCTVGEEINTENMLRGKALPDYKQLAEYVFYTATGKSLNKLAKVNPAWFIGETEAYKLHLIYKPDLNFLKSKESALHLDLAEAVKKSNSDSKKISLVFASANYISQKELKSKYGIQFCQLPCAIHKIMGV